MGSWSSMTPMAPPTTSGLTDMERTSRAFVEAGGPRKEDVRKPSVKPQQKAMPKPKPLQIFETSWLPLQQFLACGLWYWRTVLVWSNLAKLVYTSWWCVQYWKIRWELSNPMECGLRSVPSLCFTCLFQGETGQYFGPGLPCEKVQLRCGDMMAVLLLKFLGSAIIRNGRPRVLKCSRLIANFWSSFASCIFALSPLPLLLLAGRSGAVSTQQIFSKRSFFPSSCAKRYGNSMPNAAARLMRDHVRIQCGWDVMTGPVG